MEAKMACARASDILSLYIDDMLDETQAHDLRLHLDECASCSAEHEQLLCIRSALLGVPEIPLPDEFDDSFKRAMARSSEEGAEGFGRIAHVRRRRRIWASVVAVFAIGLLSVFAYQNFSGGGAELSTSADVAAEDAAAGAGAFEIMPNSEPAQEDAAPAAGASTAPRIDSNYAGVSVGESQDVASADAGAGGYAAPGERENIYISAAAEPPLSYDSYDPTGYLARGTTMGAHRLNEKALYDEMLKERLTGWEYEILSEEKRDDAYIYRINMISNSYGMEFNQEIEVVASGNALRILYATEFMGLQ
jgi:hypothetical protein